MAASDKAVWVSALVAAAVGSGAFGRYLLGTAAGGLLFGAVFALGVVLLALPLVIGELALSQVRRRNIVDTFGPGPWAAAGWAFALACIPLAAFLAMLAGWSARLAFDAFGGTFYDDPARHMRLITQGSDALLFALAAFAAAWLLGLRGARRGLRGPMLFVTGFAVIAAIGILAYGAIAGGAAGRDAAFAFAWRDLDARFVVEALQQALIPAFLGFGVVATLSAHGTDRTLAGQSLPLAAAWIGIPLAIGAGLSAIAADQGVGFDDGVGLGGLAALSAAVGGTAGGFLAGTLFGLMLAGSLAALVAVLEVPATVLVERWGWRESHANLAPALLAYLLVVPMAFVADLAFDIELLLAVVIAPLGGLLLAIHLGWARPDALDGLSLGEGRPATLGRSLRPALRYILPVPLLLLVVIGCFEAAVYVLGADAGTGGLWRLVP